MFRTFRGGVHPLRRIHEGKALTSECAIEPAQPPDTVAIPLQQHAGAPAQPLVKKGDGVYLGQRIGEASGFVSAHVHASVSGEVTGLEQRIAVNGAPVQCVVIKNDMRDAPDSSIRARTGAEADALSPEALAAVAKDAGLVGMGGAAFPAHVKFAPPKDRVIDTLLLNGAECEPYLTCDDRMMREHAASVMDGALLLQRMFGCQRVIIAVEANKRQALDALKAAAQGGVSVQSLRVKYPQGSEKQLIQTLTGRQVPSGKLPMDCGCVVVNVTSAVMFARAVREGLPVYERTVTVSGPGVARPRNLLARIGVSVGSLIEQCGGFNGEPYKLIAGGPMMGVALYDLNVPVVKAMSGLLAFTKADARAEAEGPCIHCGRCYYACPMGLVPYVITAHAQRDDWGGARRAHVGDCLECGACTYICPAKRNLSAMLRVAKRQSLARK